MELSDLTPRIEQDHPPEHIENWLEAPETVREDQASILKQSGDLLPRAGDVRPEKKKRPKTRFAVGNGESSSPPTTSAQNEDRNHHGEEVHIPCCFAWITGFTRRWG